MIQQPELIIKFLDLFVIRMSFLDLVENVHWEIYECATHRTLVFSYLCNAFMMKHVSAFCCIIIVCYFLVTYITSDHGRL